MTLKLCKQEILGNVEDQHNLHLFCNNKTISESYNVKYVQICRICFAANCHLNSMKMDKKLDQAYETLTGLLMEGEGNNMPPYLCAKCSYQLMHCIDFRSRALKAHLLLLEALRNHDCITLEKINSISEFHKANISEFDELQLTDQYNLDTVVNIIKKENVDIDEEICLRNEPNLLKNIDNDVLNEIKTEDNCIFNQDSPKDVSPNLHEDIFLSHIKVENDDGYNEDDGDIFTDDMEFEDESRVDYVPEEEQQPKTQLTIVKAEKDKEVEATKKLQENSDDKLLLYHKLCCNKYSYKTVKDVKMLGHLKNHIPNMSHIVHCTTNNIRKTANCNKERLSCYLCTKSYSTKWGLQKHMKTHTDVKEYPCEVCKKSFRESRDLRNHMRTHSGEKPYGCDLCKKTFSERGNLLRHIRIHSGEKPYSCKFCKKSFNQNHHLKRHLIKHSRR